MCQRPQAQVGAEAEVNLRPHSQGSHRRARVGKPRACHALEHSRTLARVARVCGCYLDDR